jgi:uncharacterized membrane protein YiaA
MFQQGTLGNMGMKVLVSRKIIDFFLLTVGLLVPEEGLWSVKILNTSNHSGYYMYHLL